MWCIAVDSFLFELYNKGIFNAQVYADDVYI